MELSAKTELGDTKSTSGHPARLDLLAEPMFSMLQIANPDPERMPLLNLAIFRAESMNPYSFFLQIYCKV